MPAISEPPSATAVRTGSSWTSLLVRVHEFALLAFLPTLVFTRGLNARVVELAVLSWLLLKWRGGAWPLGGKGMAFAGVFLGSYLLSSLASPEVAYSLQGLVPLVHALLLFMILVDGPFRPSFSRQLGWVAAATLFLLGLDVLTQYLGTQGWISGEPPLALEGAAIVRYRGPFSNPNDLVFAGILLPFLLLIPRPTGRGRMVWTLTMVSLFLLTACILFASGSRNVWICAGFSLAVVAWRFFRFHAVAAGGIVLLGLFLWSPPGDNILWRLHPGNWDRTGSQRMMVWEFDLWTFGKNPWLGMGPRQFPRQLEDNRREALAAGLPDGIPDDLHHPHGVHLEAFVERGVLGGAVWLFLFGLTLIPAWRYRKHPYLGPLAWAAGLAALTLFFTGSLDFSLRYRWYAYSFFFLAGLLLALERRAKELPPVGESLA